MSCPTERKACIQKSQKGIVWQTTQSHLLQSSAETDRRRWTKNMSVVDDVTLGREVAVRRLVTDDASNLLSESHRLQSASETDRRR